MPTQNGDEHDATEVPGHAFYRMEAPDRFVVYAHMASDTWVPHNVVADRSEAKRLTRKVDGRLRRLEARRKGKA